MDASAALTSFGFTALESSLYCELLRSSPQTGYRLARQLGKAPPNTYQALKGLTEKGAIVRSEEDGATATFIPVPPAQLLRGIRSDFDRRQQAAAEALEKVRAPTQGETVHQLRTVTQVLERVSAMLSGVREVTVYDMFPQIFDVLAPEIAAVRDRGVRVVGIAYRPEDATPTVPYNGEQPGEVGARWPGLGLILIVDGRELLIAQLSRDLGSVLNAVYSDSIFLSSVLHSAVSSDIQLVALRNDPADPLRMLELKHAFPPGLRAIQSDVPDQPG